MQRIIWTTSVVTVGPLHVPGVTVIVSPTLPGSFDMTGSVLQRGAAGSTTGDGADAAATDPSGLAAVTTTMRVWPTSAAVGV